jgi:hypothetical protein
MNKQGWLTAGLIAVGGALLAASMWTVGPNTVQAPFQRRTRSAQKKPARHAHPAHQVNSRKGQRARSRFPSGVATQST